MTKADWPARLHRLGAGRLVDLTPPGSELWLDGGHNPDGGRAIAAALADLEERVSRPLVLIVGMLAISLTVLVLDIIYRLVERRLTPWRRNERRH